MDFTYERVSFNADFAARIPLDDFIAGQGHLWPDVAPLERVKRLERAHELALEITGKSKRHDNGSGNAQAVGERDHEHHGNNGGSHRGNERGSDQGEPGATIGGAES